MKSNSTLILYWQTEPTAATAASDVSKKKIEQSWLIENERGYLQR